jgi:hypothetical protein
MLGTRKVKIVMALLVIIRFAIGLLRTLFLLPEGVEVIETELVPDVEALKPIILLMVIRLLQRRYFGIVQLSFAALFVTALCFGLVRRLIFHFPLL